MPVVEAKNISYRYGGDISALESISLEVEAGDFLGVMGPNGSGKTTLLGILSGVRKPDEGEILLGGQPLYKMSRKEIARKIAYLPQQISIDFPFTVRQIVLMGRFAYLKGLGIEGKEDLKKADWAMDLTGVKDLADRMIHQLSGGERQRVFIAQAITAEPEILMLDEPISSLDIKYKLQIMELLTHLNKEHGMTILTILHDLNIAGRYSRKLLFLKKGKMISAGDSGKVLNKETIKNVYDVNVEILEHGENRVPVIIPVE